MLVADMFSGEWTPPHVGNASTLDGFDAFWKAWPSGIRKVAKQQCQAKWLKHKLSMNAAHIVAHIAWMKTQEDWQKGNGAFICAPIVYLNQQRWIDWEPPTKPTIDPAVATRELLAERDRNYRPPSAEVRAKLEALRRR